MQEIFTLIWMLELGSIYHTMRLNFICLKLFLNLLDPFLMYHQCNWRLIFHQNLHGFEIIIWLWSNRLRALWDAVYEQCAAWKAPSLARFRILYVSLIWLNNWDDLIRTKYNEKIVRFIHFFFQFLFFFINNKQIICTRNKNLIKLILY